MIAWKEIKAIHCFGDSLTAGYGALPGRGWVALADKALPSISLYNHSVCGATVSDIADDLRELLPLAEAGEGFFFMGGTNDILCGYRLEFIEKKVSELLFEAVAKVPLTIGIPPLSTRESIYTGWQSEENFEGNQKSLSLYGDFLRNLSKDLGLLSLDFSKAFPAEDAWYADGLHPNGKGYEKMADMAIALWK